MNARSLSHSSATIILAAVLLGQRAGGQAPASSGGDSLTVLAKEGRRTIALTAVNGQEFVGLDDLAGAFQLAVREEADAISVTYKAQTIVLISEQALASVAGRLVSLPAAPARAGRRWLVPVEFIGRALALIYDVRLDLRKPARLLVVGDLRVPRVTARYEPLGVTARLTIDATPQATSTVVQDGDRLSVRFDADAIDAAGPLLAPQPPASLVQAIRLAEPAALSVELGPRFAGFRASPQPLDATMRLVIDLISTETATEAPGPAPAAPAPELPPAFTQPTSAIRTIAIDAGHGGDDGGSKGPGGTREKDVTLAVARRLKAAIEGRLGIRVLLTRDDDRNVPLDGRTSLANNNKADMFISLHANASMRPGTAGATIFSASFAGDAEQQVRATLAPERVPTFGGGLRDIEVVPWDLAQTRHLDHSIAFAGILEQELRDRVALATPAVTEAPLRILQSANMPAVLIEIGFLTSPAQEQALAGGEFQGAFVQGVYDSIVKFRDWLGAHGTP